MWPHHCPLENTFMEIGHGEECNYCGAREEEMSSNDERLNLIVKKFARGLSIAEQERLSQLESEVDKENPRYTADDMAVLDDAKALIDRQPHAIHSKRTKGAMRVTMTDGSVEYWRDGKLLDHDFWLNKRN